MILQQTHFCLPLKLDMSSKPVKSATKSRRPHNDPQADKESTRSGREHRPSDKIAAKHKFFVYSCLIFKKLIIMVL